MRIAITGSNGQLGRALQERKSTETLLLLDLPDHDITDLPRTLSEMESFRPEVIIHAAAMTDVDACERSPERAYHLNVVGTHSVAVAAMQCRCPLVYISTDYVFDGAKPTHYYEYDRANPLSVYARTKWMGEQVARQLVQQHYVVRIAWLYGDGPNNFVRTVLRLADEGQRLRMVTDEIGSPTYAADVAAALDQLIRRPAYGTYHLPNAGFCSRYEWAREILQLTGRGDVALEPTENYVRAAPVPKRVMLYNAMGSSLGIVPRPWQEALSDFVARHDLARQP